MAAGQTAISTPTKRDFRREVTDSIIKLLEQGVAPWQTPWEPGAGIEMPLNPTTKRAYRGGNALHLLALGARREYGDPRWMTYRQAQARGWQVRGGERGTHVEFWEFPRQSASEQESNDPERGSETRTRLVHRVYTVFNARQIDGIGPHVPNRRTEFEAVQAGESILDHSGARIAHDQHDRAFYSRASDSIHLPPRLAFKTTADYYGTALHELAHWSGHPTRLNRASLNESYRFGDLLYAKEELRAELASLFLAAERGIPHDPQNHAAYVGIWLQTLRDDKNEIFRAAADAQIAADFLLGLERHRSLDKALEEARSPQLRRETAEYVAEYDAASGTVDIEQKRTATELRTPAEAEPLNTPDALSVPEAIAERILDDQVQGIEPNPTDLKNSFAEAQELCRRALGENARTFVAHTDSGAYRGEVIGQTWCHIVQKISPQSAVAHMRHLLSRLPEPGQNVLIAYSNERAAVDTFHPREQSRGLER